MKKAIFVFLTFGFIAGANQMVSGQDVKCDSIYELAGQMPFYGKGPQEFFKYLNKNLIVKKPCKAADIKRLIFIVNKDGKISDIEVVGVTGKCQEELISQLKTFPDWTPGKDLGQPVCVRVIMPIQLKPRTKEEKEEDEKEKEQEKANGKIKKAE